MATVLCLIDRWLQHTHTAYDEMVPALLPKEGKKIHVLPVAKY